MKPPDASPAEEMGGWYSKSSRSFSTSTRRSGAACETAHIMPVPTCQSNDAADLKFSAPRQKVESAPPMV
eukprot:886241-Prymnesium_polylepis.1